MIRIEKIAQIYANETKEKLNMALVVAGERLYGIDKEGGFYHEHPFENPLLHINTKQSDISIYTLCQFLNKDSYISFENALRHCFMAPKI